MSSISNLTPAEIVAELDKYVVGQQRAKRAVAIALRNRYLRQQVKGTMRMEITPKNILMIGPTGVGKSELARRLAKLSGAPFVKVEATKYTEVGYVGRDVESMVTDLVQEAYKLIKANLKSKRESEAVTLSVTKEEALEEVLDLLVQFKPQRTAKRIRERFRQDYLENRLNNTRLSVPMQNEEETEEELLSRLDNLDLDGEEEPFQAIMKSMFSGKNQPPVIKQLTVPEAVQYFQDNPKATWKYRDQNQPANKPISEAQLQKQALQLAEHSGIIFIDEIDKIAGGGQGASAGVSRQGVQRDLLPLLEGTTVETKHGQIRTDHILFITSGAFQLSPVSDLIPEIQGRLPIRVEMDSLTTKDFVEILSNTETSLIRQYAALLKVEGIKLNFTENGIERVAQFASDTNDNVENIGARRLHTVMERLLEDFFYNAPKYKGKTVNIDAAYVERVLSDIVHHVSSARNVL